MSDQAKVLDTGIVHMPGRQYPGVVIQGDSLSIWLSRVEEIRAAIARGDITEASAELASLEEGIRDWQKHYEEVLGKHGIDLPYVRKKREV